MTENEITKKAKELYDEYLREAPHFTFNSSKFIAKVKRLARQITATDPAIMYLDCIATRMDIDINPYLKEA